MQSAGISNIDHSQILHSSQTNPQQLQVPRNNAGIPNMYASSPTPSTSTDGSDFTSGHFSNQSNPMQHTEHSTAPLKVPLHIGVDLPPQVLKVMVFCLFVYLFTNLKINQIPIESVIVIIISIVLQVRTVLENPTRYHVIQKQKNQVRQYLSESFQQSDWNENQPIQQLQQHHQSKQEVTQLDIVNFH